jgi:gamma-glutamyltranspeptidase/glutathione hydrolase
VIYPDQTALGGDCFFLSFAAANGEVTAYNGSGAAPAAADPGSLLVQGWTSMPAKGPLTVTVPGTVDAWAAGHARFGTLELEEILAPAIALARDGFPVSARLAAVLAAQGELINAWPGLRALVFPGGTLPGEGTILRLPALARSMEAIARDGRDAFYEGHIAEAIDRTMRDLGGWLTADDLAHHSGLWVEPVSATYRGMTVLTTPPNSQGIAALIGLRLAERESPGQVWGAAGHVHPLVEASRRAYEVRNARISDPSFVDIDVDELLDDTFLDGLWSDYSSDSAQSGPPVAAGDTVYLCAIDRDGNAVSLIQSLYGAFGSAVVADDTGILLQNRGTWFSLDAAHPNVLAPGKRTMHTLMPSMLFEDGAFRGVFGTQGGDAQAQIQMQLVSNLVDFGLDPQEAIEAPRWLGGANGELLLEAGFPEGTVQLLAARGHQVSVIAPWNPGAGHAQMILVDPATGVLKGAADPRADGTAAGF